MDSKPNRDGSVDKAKGHANETVGKVKEKVGQFIGDDKLEAKGQTQNAEGKAQRVKGEVKEKVTETVDKVKAGAEVVKDRVKDALHQD